MIQYRRYSLDDAEIHTLWIPLQSRFVVRPALSETLEPLENFGQRQDAIAVLNGGFFDPVNQKSTSFITIQEQPVADPQDNERLINNPDLAPYLDRILNRTELRRYQCGAENHIQYDIVLHRQPEPAGCRLVDALGSGPQLLPDLTLMEEGFLDRAPDGTTQRDALGSERPNARTAVGLIGDRQLIWVMVAQKPDAPTTSGLTLPALAEWMRSLGVEKAMNLDGGSSSALYYQGKTIYGKVDAAGSSVERPVKSVLWVEELYAATKTTSGIAKERGRARNPSHV
jgi:hypothetical protein